MIEEWKIKAIVSIIKFDNQIRRLSHEYLITVIPKLLGLRSHKLWIDYTKADKEKIHGSLWVYLPKKGKGSL